MKTTPTKLKTFQKTVWNYYHKNGRHSLPWRHTSDPYKILVSEIMLQQTQVDRVVPKYHAFIKQFPNFKTLATAPLQKVLAAWSGLGYNRRGLYLKKLAETITTNFKGTLPNDRELLQTLSGLGPATSASVLVFAFNTPLPFIETNIRTVFLHHFFPNQKNIPDTKLWSLIEKTTDTKNPREWYWALMDYGVFLKKQFKNPSRASAHHTKQSTFEGSDRQLRGKILRLLTSANKLTLQALARKTNESAVRVKKIISTLKKDALITQRQNYYLIDTDS